MFSMVQVNRIYLIFNPVHFLVDSSEIKIKIKIQIKRRYILQNIGVFIDDGWFL
jgi:hypothetical protein